MPSTDPPPSSFSDQEEVKEDTTPAASTQHAHISFSDEQEDAAGGGGGDDGSSVIISGLPGNSTHPSTSSSMSSREWRSRSLPSRTEISKEEDGYPAPPQLSLMTSVHSVVSHVQDYIHHMPKWQYRCMLASIVLLVFALIMVLTCSVLYGFNMHLPHVQVVDVQLPLPFPFADANGNIPVVSSILFSNPNPFPATTKPADIHIYALPSRSPASLLAVASTPSLKLAAHEQKRALSSTFLIHEIGSVDGGRALVNAVLQGENNFLYTTSISDISVKGLGLIPISRSFKNDCTVLKKWGANSLTLSDCYGQFA